MNDFRQKQNCDQTTRRKGKIKSHFLSVKTFVTAIFLTKSTFTQYYVVLVLGTIS